MKTYILNRYKGGKTLYPKSDFTVSDVLHEEHEFSLDEHYVNDEHGRTFCRYRLHTKEPYRFYDTLDYDIKCPRCGDVLRLCGNVIVNKKVPKMSEKIPHLVL